MRKSAFFLSLPTFFLLVFFAGCTNILGNNDDDDDDESSELSVSLSADKSAPYYSAETLTFTATAKNAGGTLAYAWYVDDVEQTNLASTINTVEYFRLASSTVSVTIRVDVIDGTKRASDQLSLTINPTASVLIENRSGSTLYYFYMKETNLDSTTNPSFSSTDDIFGSNTYLFNNRTILIYGIDAATYFIGYSFQDGGASYLYWDTSKSFWAGYYRKVTISSTEIGGGTIYTNSNYDSNDGTLTSANSAFAGQGPVFRTEKNAPEYDGSESSMENQTFTEFGAFDGILREAGTTNMLQIEAPKAGLAIE